MVIAETTYAERIALIAEQLPDLRCVVHRGAAPEGNLGDKVLVPEIGSAVMMQLIRKLTSLLVIWRCLSTRAAPRGPPKAA